jgi:hypothetical protein
MIFSTKRQERGISIARKPRSKKISRENDRKPKGLPFFREPSYGVHAPKPFFCFPTWFVTCGALLEMLSLASLPPAGV